MKGLYIVPIVLLLFLHLFLSGCSNRSTGAEESKVMKEDEIISTLKAPKIPETYKEIVNFPAGIYATRTYGNSTNDREDFQHALDQLPIFPEKLDEEMQTALYGELLSLFAEDYGDYENILRDFAPLSLGDPKMNDPRYQFKENFNVEIILDASGSMKNKVGGKTKMEIAKEAIHKFMKSLPQEANVSLRVYGYVSGGKEASCNSIKRVYGLEPYEAGKFSTALGQIQPSGWTPLAKSIEAAKKDMAALDGESNTNYIFIVTDGLETCGGDPVKATKDLSLSNLTPIVHIVGFDIKTDEKKQLQNMAQAADGIFTAASNEAQLTEELNRVKEIAEKWEDWKTDSLTELDKQLEERLNEAQDFRDQMISKSFNEEGNIMIAIDYLSHTEKISGEEDGILKSKVKDRTNFIRERIEEESQRVSNQLQLNYELEKKQIEAKFAAK
ncbi:vWA domain-containing protein [Schinkia sp. CFF1]